MSRRWRKDGPDYHTGCQTFDIDSLPRGPGGMVWWMHDGCWLPRAWTRDREYLPKRHYRRLETAKRAVERWLEKYGD